MRFCSWMWFYLNCKIPTKFVIQTNGYSIFGSYMCEGLFFYLPRDLWIENSLRAKKKTWTIERECKNSPGLHITGENLFEKKRRMTFHCEHSKYPIHRKWVLSIKRNISTVREFSFSIFVNIPIRCFCYVFGGDSDWHWIWR